jgi:hypothetical protein
MPNRRQILQNTAAGFGWLAASDLLAAESNSAHFAVPARIQRVIFLFMYGGPSQVDSFDYKPALAKDHGKPLPFAKPRVQFQGTKNLFRSPWKFRQYGQSGTWVSDLFPKIGKCADDLTFVHSLYGSNPAHGGALLKIHTGTDTFVRPSLGAWVSYGLGSENDNLPSFVTIDPILNHGGVQNFGSAFLPAVHQATRIEASRAEPIANLRRPTGSESDLQQMKIEMLRDLNRRQAANASSRDPFEARAKSFELAFRMQTAAPEAMDIERETKQTQRMYGLDEPRTSPFGRQCLLARRLAERGVRFIQCTHRDGSKITWDDHSNLTTNHPRLAADVDQPIAGLLTDLKQRGLLDETLVIWGGEFGRTPTMEGSNGRDHNPHGFTWWMAGGGVRSGFHFGATDEYGYYAVQDRVHIHDLHATILHLLGLDHEKLTYRHAGRDFRLTDVHGRVVHEILA